MRHIAIGALASLVIMTSGSTVKAQQRSWISIEAAGVECGAFVPVSRPYSDGGPAVSVYLPDRRDIRMADGRALTGFEFIGWHEGSAVRVQIFALVPAAGRPNAYLPGGHARNLVRRDFASYLVTPDRDHSITEMRAFGIEPMTLRAVLR